MLRSACLPLMNIHFSIIYRGFKPLSSLHSQRNQVKGSKKWTKKHGSRDVLSTTTTVIVVAREAICSAATVVLVLFI